MLEIYFIFNVDRIISRLTDLYLLEKSNNRTTHINSFRFFIQ